MHFKDTGIVGSWLVESDIHADERGLLFEWFKSSSVENNLLTNFDPKQANFSNSNANVIRGIHYSLAGNGQAKWVTCVSGSIYDVVVDTRKESPTFGKWFGVELKANSGKSLFLSGSLGHAFLALEDDTSVMYLLSSEYNPQFEFAINPLDTDINILWPCENKILSQKDLSAPTLYEQLAARNLP